MSFVIPDSEAAREVADVRMGHVHVLRLMMPDSQQALCARGVGNVHVRLSGSYLSREWGNGLWGLEMGIT